MSFVPTETPPEGGAHKVADLTPDLARERRLNADQTGALIAAVNSGSEVSACGITPIEFRTPSASFRTSCPATRAEPSVGGVSVVSMRISVVLPAPFGPSRPKISPSSTLKRT